LHRSAPTTTPVQRSAWLPQQQPRRRTTVRPAVTGRSAPIGAKSKNVVVTNVPGALCVCAHLVGAASLTLMVRGLAARERRGEGEIFHAVHLNGYRDVLSSLCPQAKARLRVIYDVAVGGRGARGSLFLFFTSFSAILEERKKISLLRCHLYLEQLSRSKGPLHFPVGGVGPQSSGRARNARATTSRNGGGRGVAADIHIHRRAARSSRLCLRLYLFRRHSRCGHPQKLRWRWKL